MLLVYEKYGPGSYLQSDLQTNNGSHFLHHWRVAPKRQKTDVF